MAMVAKDVSEADKIAIAEYLSGKRLEQKFGALPDGSQCQATLPASASEGPQWNGWGNDITNSRFQSAAAAAITPEPSRSSS
jgi:polyvinyl alcohol dehydrogenase (cytochrome)